MEFVEIFILIIVILTIVLIFLANYKVSHKNYITQAPAPKEKKNLR